MCTATSWIQPPLVHGHKALCGFYDIRHMHTLYVLYWKDCDYECDRLAPANFSCYLQMLMLQMLVCHTVGNGTTCRPTDARSVPSGTDGQRYKSEHCTI